MCSVIQSMLCAVYAYVQCTAVFMQCICILVQGAPPAMRARAGSHDHVITPCPVQVLRRRCEHALGSDGFELLHSWCLANGGQLTRPLDLEVRRVTLPSYHPSVWRRSAALLTVSCAASCTASHSALCMHIDCMLHMHIIHYA